MTSEITGYREAVQTIKTAILQAQYAAAKKALTLSSCSASCLVSGASPQQVSNICEPSLKLGLPGR